MAGEFPEKDVEDLLAQCKRRCCICHRFCGTKMETHHMDPKGGNAIANAIPVCFDCHAEIGSYNPKHPRGRKFTARELRQHKAAWLKLCAKHPEVFATAPHVIEVGPLWALIQEMELNEAIAEVEQHTGGIHDMPPLLSSEHFHNALRAGALTVLGEDAKKAVLDAYSKARLYNQQVELATHQEYGKSWAKALIQNSVKHLQETNQAFKAARETLLGFLER